MMYLWRRPELNCYVMPTNISTTTITNLLHLPLHPPDSLEVKIIYCIWNKNAYKNNNRQFHHHPTVTVTMIDSLEVKIIYGTCICNPKKMTETCNTAEGCREARKVNRLGPSLYKLHLPPNMYGRMISCVGWSIVRPRQLHKIGFCIPWDTVYPRAPPLPKISFNQYHLWPVPFYKTTPLIRILMWEKIQEIKTKRKKIKHCVYRTFYINRTPKSDAHLPCCNLGFLAFLRYLRTVY